MISDKSIFEQDGKLFCDCGGGFPDQANVTIQPIQEAGRLLFNAKLPVGCKEVRFEPAGGNVCILYDLTICIDNQAVKVNKINGIKQGSNVIFDNTNPKIWFAVPAGGTDLLIKTTRVQLFSDRETLLESSLSSMRAELAALRKQNAVLKTNYNNCMNSFSWRITKPLRRFFSPLKKKMKANRSSYLIFKGLKKTFLTIPRKVYKKAKKKLAHARIPRGTAVYPFTRAELKAQRHEIFPKDIRFSVVVPLYNTRIKFLIQMIRSLRDQTYGKWELCLADGSDRDHLWVGRVCRFFATIDKRIKYRKLEKNLGISDNTNAALAMASGEYIALFDHDDYLHPAALHEVMHEVCEKNADFIYTDEAKFSKSLTELFEPNLKPDYAPDTLRSYNYICHLCVFSAELLKQAGGGFRSEYDGSQDYDLILRLTEKAKQIVHIPKVLYYWRSYQGSTAASISAKPYTMAAGRKAVAAHLQRIGLRGDVVDARYPTTYHVQYQIQGNPLISIIIPNKDHVEELYTCIRSILDKSSYRNFEIIIVENNSVEDVTFSYYKELEKNPYIQIVKWAGEFNYSSINNFGAQFAKGEHILLLNNDVEVISPDWLEQMLMFSQREDVGAVGAMLYYPDDTVQHAGVILGFGGVAGHAHLACRRNTSGYMSRMAIAQNYSAVTAACMLIRRNVWGEVDGLEPAFKVAFNDVDLCMKIRRAGYLIVWTPFAELYHYESRSRGYEDTPEKQERFQGEIQLFQERWKNELEAGDPYYNPNFILNGLTYKINN